MTTTQPRAVLALGTGFVSAGATALVYSPMFLSDPNQAPGVVTVIWLSAVLGAGPLTAFLMNRQWPTATDFARRLLTGLPQLPLVVLLMEVDVLLDVRSGYLPPGSSEHAMAYGFGRLLAALGGLLLWALVGQAAGRGASRPEVVPGREREAGTAGTGSSGQAS